MLNIYNMDAQQLVDLDAPAIKQLYKSFCAMHGVSIEEKAAIKPPVPPKISGPVINFHEVVGITFKDINIANEVAEFVNARLHNAVSPHGRQSLDWDMRDYAGGVQYGYDTSDTRVTPIVNVTTQTYTTDEAIKTFKEKFKQYKADKKEFESRVAEKDSSDIMQRAFFDLCEAADVIVATRRKLDASLAEYLTLVEDNRVLAIKLMEKAGVIGPMLLEAPESVQSVTGYAERLARREFYDFLSGVKSPSMIWVCEHIRKRLEAAGFTYEDPTEVANA